MVGNKKPLPTLRRLTYDRWATTLPTQHLKEEKVVSIEEIKVPVLSESVADAVLLNWQKKTGDLVQEGDTLIEIETDKVVLEVPAPKAGTLMKIIKDAGSQVLSEEVIAQIETGVVTSKAPKPVSTPVAPPEPTAEVPPTVEAVVEPMAEVPPTVEAIVKPTPSPESNSSSAKTSPAVRKMAAEQGIDPSCIQHQGDRVTKADMVQQNSEPQGLSEAQESEVATLSASKTDSDADLTAPQRVELTSSPQEAQKGEPIPLLMSQKEGPIVTPVYQQEASRPQDEESTRYSVTPGKAFAAFPEAPSGVTQGEKTTDSGISPAMPNLSDRHEERVPMNRLRKRVAERLLQAQHEHAILTTFNEINMKAVIDLRNQYKEKFEKQHGVKLGFMSFFTKATVAALQKFPIINASIEGEEIVYHGYYDIGIAVSSSRGLVVPIMRDVDAMSFADVEKNIANFARRAQDGQLTLEDLTGGTFSITNGGIFGSMLSTPILNPPQSAILGLHNIVDRPVAEKGQVVIRPVMYVALSYDHRLIDGRDAVQFLVAIKNAIEDPARLLLDI
jgi:2-oxoglutarate dehydrogenase E2 component (dihydrolipoamide succinyltransferase)